MIVVPVRAEDAFDVFAPRFLHGPSKQTHVLLPALSCVDLRRGHPQRQEETGGTDTAVRASRTGEKTRTCAVFLCTTPYPQAVGCSSRR